MQIATNYVAFVIRRRWAFLAVALVLTLLSAFSVRFLKVNSSIEALLPEGTPSSLALEELRTRLQSSSPMYLLIQSSDAALNRRLARQVAEDVKVWPETRWAIYKRDASVFEDNRLLYLEADDLLELNEQIDERQRWEECERLPGCSNLDDEPPPLPTEEDLHQLFQKNPDIAALTSLFGAEASSFSQTAPKSTARASGENRSKDAANAEPAGHASETGDLCSADGQLCAVQVSIEGNASDLDFATSLYERGEAVLANARPADAPEDLKMVVSGRYRTMPMTKALVASDLQKTSLFSAAMILLVVMFQFRGLRSLLMLALPAALGLGWTAGLLGVVHPELNMVSAFTLAVLAGVGIDFGVHLLTHYSRERGDGLSPEQSLKASFSKLGPSLLVAAFTTACGFGALGVASFRGFAEMGPIAALGIVITLAAYAALFPVLTLLLDRRSECAFELRSFSWSPWGWLRRKSLPLATIGAGCVVVFGYLGTGAEFEYNSRNLRPQAISHGIPWTKAMHGTTRTAVYLMADDEQALHDVAAALRQERPKELLKSERPFLVVPAAFIPSDQEERLDAISKLRETLKRAKRKADNELKAKIEEYEPLAAVTQPVKVEQMPVWVTDWLMERDGRFGTLAILYTDLSGADARQMELLSDQLEQWRRRFPKVRFASAEAPLGEVTPRLRSETPGIVGLALLGVCLGTLLIGRSIKRMLLVLLPLSMVLSVGLGLAALLDVRMNLYNMLVFPLAFGIGVDGAVYVAWALSGDGGKQSAEEAERGQLERLPTAARAVLGSTLTSMAGFGALMISGIPGLASIGELAVLMLGASLLGNLIWLPCLSWAAPRRNPA